MAIEESTRNTTTGPAEASRAGRGTSELADRALASLTVAEEGLAVLQQDLTSPDTDRRAPPRRTALAVSVVIPVYNERTTIEQIVQRVRAAQIHTEILIVDDCSTDGTRDLLIELDRAPDVRVVMHGYNKGKGAALHTAFERARGEVLIIQDADLEYDPADFARLIEPIEQGEADAVFGSRFLENPRQDRNWWHRLGNRALTKLSNLTTGLALTDMETCYKVFRRPVLRGMVLRESRFGFEPEFTAKLARRRCRIKEVPVRYEGRGFGDGKKIGVRDAVRAVYCIFRYAWFD